MKLSKLLRDVPVKELHADPDLEISNVICDSRKAEKNCLFLAISGFASDGNRFIPMAVDMGCALCRY